LLVRRQRRSLTGRSKTVRPSGTFTSSQAAILIPINSSTVLALAYTVRTSGDRP
jgi:hypothetical protein